MSTRPRTALPLLLLPLAACRSTEALPPPTPQALVAELEPGAREFVGYGGYRRELSATTPGARSWFDQGLQMVYGFNHDAGVRCFAAAAAADPDCAMAWWGIAYGYGIDVNNPAVEPHESAAAYAASLEAQRCAPAASEVERALIEAVALRAVHPLPEDRVPLDEAYAEAMGRAWTRFPTDPDVGALYAEALMNLQPWDYWTAEGEPVERAEEIVAVLEQVLELDPAHPGANHFYIHAVEASKTPGRAEAAAERLEELVPGSGHLVHMPSHIYINVGRYDDAVTSNQRAIQADEAYFAEMGEPSFYHLYFIHNIHFLAYAAMMEGRSEIALDATRRMEREVPPQFLAAFPEFADGLMPAKFHALIRFGRWQEILDEPAYSEERKVSRAVRLYARIIALANLDRAAQAREELALFDEAVAQVPPEWFIGINPAAAILALARQMAEGELLWREGRHEDAYEVLRAAVEAEDALVYDEPPGWMIPVRHALGALLLAGGESTEALELYQLDLEDNPENAWSLLGLRQTLEALGRSQEAEAFALRVAAAWARADVDPPASCYCGRRPAESARP